MVELNCSTVRMLTVDTNKGQSPDVTGTDRKSREYKTEPRQKDAG